MIEWVKLGRETNDAGEVTVIYGSDDGRFEIQSRRRAVPHVNCFGYWMHVIHTLIDNQTGKEKEFFTLRDAKAAAERMTE